MEKFFGTKGRRALSGFAMAAVGAGLFVLSEEFQMFGESGIVSLVSMFLFMIGFFIGISIIDVTKTKVISSFNVKTGKYDSPCFVLRKNYHAYFVIPFVGIFYYIPYKSEYYLVKNLSVGSWKKKKCINDFIIEADTFNIEKITRKQFWKIRINPQILSAKIQQENEKNKSNFYRVFKKYFDEGIIKEEIKSTDYYSVFRVQDGSLRFAFFKESEDNSFKSMKFSELLIHQLDNQQISVFEACATTNLVKVVSYSDKNLESILRMKERLEKYKRENSELLQKNKEPSQPKTIVTQQMIFESLRQVVKLSNNGVIFDLISSVMGIVAVCVGIWNSNVFLLILGILIGISGFVLSIRSIIKNRKTKKELAVNGYRIEKSVCIDVLIKHDDENGDSYIHYFENDLSIETQQRKVQKGAECFLIILNDTQTVADAFDTNMYQLDNDLFLGNNKVNSFRALMKKPQKKAK